MNRRRQNPPYLIAAPTPSGRARGEDRSSLTALGHKEDESEPEFIVAPPRYALLKEEAREYVEGLLEVLVDTALRHQLEKEQEEREDGGKREAGE